jgi:hypothetical protein
VTISQNARENFTAALSPAALRFSTINDTTQREQTMVTSAAQTIEAGHDGQPEAMPDWFTHFELDGLFDDIAEIINENFIAEVEATRDLVK